MTREEAIDVNLWELRHEDYELLINKIFNDFDSRTCGNCKYSARMEDILLCSHECNTQEIHNYNPMQVTLDFSCNKFEREE